MIGSVRAASPSRVFAILVAILALAGSARAQFARGADISWLPQMEAANVSFHDASGTKGELLDILEGLGVNSVRLRVWVDPADGHSGKLEVASLARRATAKGMRVLVDFHFSDTWVDPGVQTKPVAWSGHTFEQLKTDVAAHVTDVLASLKDSGTIPEWVQIGNETNDGMLWQDGRATVSMANFAALVQSGAKAVRAASPSTKIVIHLSNAFDNVMYRWIFDGMKTNGVDYDVIGMSLYPDTTTWRATSTQAKANMQDMVSRYGKPVMICEVGMERTSPDSTYALLKTLLADVAALPGGKGLGVFYWEPQAFELWGGYKKSAFDNTGKPTKALEAFREMMVATSASPRSPKPVFVSRQRDVAGRPRDVAGGIEPRY